MLFNNWGIRLLMAFLTAVVHCVSPYFSSWRRHMFLPAAVFKLFSTPSPPVLYQLTQDVLSSQLPELYCASSSQLPELQSSIGAANYLSFKVLLKQLVTSAIDFYWNSQLPHCRVLLEQLVTRAVEVYRSSQLPELQSYIGAASYQSC